MLTIGFVGFNPLIHWQREHGVSTLRVCGLLIEWGAVEVYTLDVDATVPDATDLDTVTRDATPPALDVYIQLLGAYGLDDKRSRVGAIMLHAMGDTAAPVFATGARALVAWLRKRDDASLDAMLSRHATGA